VCRPLLIRRDRACHSRLVRRRHACLYRWNSVVAAASYWLGYSLCGRGDRAEVSLSALGDSAICKTYMFINSYLE
jgi:hypothetical protein